MACRDIAAGCASAGQLAARLVADVSPEEWHQLEEGGLEGEISAFNRSVLLRLRECGIGNEECGIGNEPDESFDAAGAGRMADLLEDFLNRHMSDNPSASRWIQLSCLALAFVFHEPLHPVEIVGAEVREAGGKVIYYCPAREGDETLCGYCVCRPMSELPEI